MDTAKISIFIYLRFNSRLTCDSPNCVVSESLDAAQTWKNSILGSNIFYHLDKCDAFTLQLQTSRGKTWEYIYWGIAVLVKSLQLPSGPNSPVSSFLCEQKLIAGYFMNCTYLDPLLWYLGKSHFATAAFLWADDHKLCLLINLLDCLIHEYAEICRVMTHFAH